MAELLEWSHLGHATEQYQIGLQIEAKVRETVSLLVARAFTRTDETYAIVNTLSKKLQQLHDMYKTDSERLGELSRLDKQVERIANA